MSVVATPSPKSTDSGAVLRHLPRLLAVLFVLAAVMAPAPATAQPDWNEVVGIFTESGEVRLDIGTRAVKENVPASHDSWATRLIIKRLDGPSEGAVSPNHVVGIFSEDGRVRLDLGTWAMKENIPASHDSWATRLRIVRLTGLSLGPITYGEVVGVFSENGQVRLDVGSRAMKKEVPASHDSWATRLRIRSLIR